jgi:hypothetical protein
VAAETTRLAGWLAGWLAVTVETGERHRVRTRTLSELSLGRVSVGRVSAELMSWHITRKWCAGAHVAAGPALWAVSGLLFSWVRSMRRRPADWGGRDDEAGWRRLGFG